LWDQLSEKYLEEVDHADSAMETGDEPVCDFVSGEAAGMKNGFQRLTQGNWIPHLRRPSSWVTGRLRRESGYSYKMPFTHFF